MLQGKRAVWNILEFLSNNFGVFFFSWCSFLCFFLRRAGDFYKPLNHVVEILGRFGIGSSIIDLFPVPAADNQTC